jgi:hypothetical protein
VPPRFLCDKGVCPWRTWRRSARSNGWRPRRAGCSSPDPATPPVCGWSPGRRRVSAPPWAATTSPSTSTRRCCRSTPTRRACGSRPAPTTCPPPWPYAWGSRAPRWPWPWVPGPRWSPSPLGTGGSTRPARPAASTAHDWTTTSRGRATTARCTRRRREGSRSPGSRGGCRCGSTGTGAAPGPPCTASTPMAPTWRCGPSTWSGRAGARSISSSPTPPRIRCGCGASTSPRRAPPSGIAAR